MDEQALEKMIKENRKLIEEVLANQCDDDKGLHPVSLANAKNIDKILFLLNGNGNPSTGVVYKLDRLYEWMSEHKIEHKAVEESRKDKTWDVVRGIISWVIPIIAYGLAYFIFVQP